MDVESRDYAPGETFSDHPTTKEINGDYVMEMDEVGDDGDTSESDEQEGAEDGGGQTDEESVDEDLDDDEENIEEEHDGDSADSDQEGSEISPKTTTSGEGTEEAESANVSPVEAEAVPQKRGRGRPKKILHDNDILNALDESYHDKPKRVRKDVQYESDGDEDSDEEEDEEDISDKKDESLDDNVRRSGRERKAPRKFEAVIPKKKKKKKRFSSGSEPPEEDEEDSDYSSKKKKRKAPKRDKFGIYKKASPTKVTRKKPKKVVSEDEDDQEGDTDSDNEYSRSWKNKMKKNKKKGTVITSADYGGDKKSSRARNTTKYQEEETSHSSDVNTDYDVQEAEAVEEEEDIETLEAVLDYRRGRVGATGDTTMYWTVKNEGDPNETLETEATEDQYYIKWKGWSHINNTWESQHSLDAKKKGTTEVKGIRRLYNYQQKISEYNSWKRFANPEDVEYQEIELEVKRQLLMTYMEVERIISTRKNESHGLDYYVKWKNLPYADCTWEDESVMDNYFTEALEEYRTRKKQSCNPRSYQESIKYFKKTFKSLKEQPSFIGSEELRLRDYQLDGLNFMLKAWHNGDSLILGDEMGLGKTIQSISFLRYLFNVYPFKGPMLVVVPLSTMAAWQKAFQDWAPEINTVTYSGSAASREIIRKFELENEDGELTFNALLTNYEMVCKDKTFFQDIVWSNIVIDEAHRLKNKESLLYTVLTTVDSYHRLLLTGTPLQNSLKELWCLLSYLQLDVENIETWERFEANYGTPEDRAAGYSKLHSLLKPYIIRRMKKDVEKSLPPKVEQILRVDMTVRQKKVYKLVLTRNYDALSRGKSQVSLINIMMQLRKTCNHVELLQEQEETVYSQEERLKQLIYGSGKLLLLDKLLKRFREKGDRVLVFSQMVTMLNLIEDYMQLKRYPYQRIDGGVSGEKRKQSIAQFNDPTSKDFCFLLSTKAGGLGINLQTANRVVIFDSDWNPQNDLQAIARAHRIGQKEEVKIFRFVASSSVDEDIIHRAKKKMVLDHLVIQSMDTTGKAIIGGAKEEKKGAVPFDKNELNMILKFGAEDLFKNEDAEEQDKEVDLDAILESAEVREEDEAPQSEANKELLSAFKCTNIAFDEDEDDEEEELQQQPKDWSDIIPSAMVEQHRTKTGVEMYSDPEELFNPIAMRRKRRNAKKRPGDEDESAPNSASQSRAGSVQAEEKDGEDSVDSDISDGEREILNTLKKKGYKDGISDKKYSKKTVKCLECSKAFVERKALRKHMVKLHNMPQFKFSAANKLDDVTNTETRVEVDPELLTLENVKKKRGPPAGNTRCFACNKSFQHRLGYKNHIKNRHEGVEPPENLDPKNLALPDERISCLICSKKFTSVPGLKGHIHNFHLGLNSAKNNNTEDEEDDPLKDDSDQPPKTTGKSVTPEEARLIEKMYYLMRRYGCAFCPVRFNNKAKLQMHESVHAKSKKPVICPYCEKSYSKRDKLKNHIERIHPGKPMPDPSSPVKKSPPPGVKITSSGQTSPAAGMTLATVVVKGKSKFQCPHCRTLFTYRKGCIRHIKQFHVDGDEPSKVSKKPAAKKVDLVNVSDDDEDDEEGENDVEEINDDVEESVTPAPVSVPKVTPAKAKDYPCPVCKKMYASYMSLYMHKKTKHPGIAAKGGSNPPTSNGDVQVLQLGVGGLTPTGRREKVHQCATCHKKYADLKGLAAHIEKIHSVPDQNVKNTASKDCECPYCENVYSRRDKLYEHIRKIHPGREVPKIERSPKSKNPQVSVEDDDSNQSQESSVDSINSGSGYGSGKIVIQQVKLQNRVQNLFQKHLKRGQQRPKEFTCSFCNKGYVDPVRLKNHIETKHEQRDDPWSEVGPNTDIAIRNRLARGGYEVYKVLGLYSTGLRMKAARFRLVDADKWVLTEEINKTVMKHDIISILQTLKKENGFYQLDEEELIRLQDLLSNSSFESKQLRMSVNGSADPSIAVLDDERMSKIEREDENGYSEEEEDTLYSGGAETFTENENGEVMVQPVFESGEEVHVFTNGDHYMEVDTM